MSSPLEEYALIGDCETAALVGRDGSIDWLCWPDFGSASCFGRLLGDEKHGYWRIAPAGEIVRTSRRYANRTLILETTFATVDGAVELVDFMPIRGDNSDIVRIVRGIRGRVAMRMELVLRFSYGSLIPWVTGKAQEWRAVAGPDLAILRTPVVLEGAGEMTGSEFVVAEGEQVPFVLTYGASHRPAPRAVEPSIALDETRRFWEAWACRGTYDGPYAAAVERSLITLKALSCRPTGGMVAAPTTSLPERLGGMRNWDYRYSWLRDATATLLALADGGHHDEARQWERWLLRTIAGSPDQLQVLYDVRGARYIPEWEAGWLPGYAGSQPVRIGNAAANQLQLDVYGEVADAIFHSLDAPGATGEVEFRLMSGLVNHLEAIWRKPDHGIWEVRGQPQCFTHSKVLAWVAFDRAIRTATALGEDAPLERWQGIRAAIHREVCQRSYSETRGTFVRSYESEALDASLLLMPLVGFLPHADERIRRTVDVIARELMCGGLVMRYDTNVVSDDLPAGEGAFLACSCWMASNLAHMGRTAEARDLFERVLGLANDVGLLAEEYDMEHGRLVGNFPQALSHIAVANTAFDLKRASTSPRRLSSRTGSAH